MGFKMITAGAMRTRAREYFKDEINELMGNIEDVIRTTAENGGVCVVFRAKGDTDVCIIDAVLERLTDSGFNAWPDVWAAGDHLDGVELAEKVITLNIAWTSSVSPDATSTSR